MTTEEELKKELYELNKIIEEYRAREDYSSPYQTYLIQQGEIKFELKGIQEGRAEERERVLEIIDKWFVGADCSECMADVFPQGDLDRLKSKIKGARK